MIDMQQKIADSVLAVVGTYDGAKIAELLGTGIVIAENLLITCDHVVRRTMTRQYIGGAPREFVAVHRGDRLFLHDRLEDSESQDLLLLRFSSLPAAPARIFRVPGLAGRKVDAFGFSYPWNGPELNTVRGLTGKHDQHFEERLQYSQFDGGAPRGFSGGPVALAGEGEPRIVGMLQLGGEDAATSRMIAADRIAGFLEARGVPGVEFPAMNLPPIAEAVAAATARGAEQIVRLGSVGDMKLDATNDGDRGANQVVDVGTAGNAEIRLSNCSRTRR